MMKTAEANFKIALQSQDAKKCKWAVPLIHNVCVCLERGGTGILHSLNAVDSSHLSLKICGFGGRAVEVPECS